MLEHADFTMINMQLLLLKIYQGVNRVAKLKSNYGVILKIQVKIIAEDRATLEIAKIVARNHPGQQQSLGRSSLPIQTGIMVML